MKCSCKNRNVLNCNKHPAQPETFCHMDGKAKISFLDSPQFLSKHGSGFIMLEAH